uniref:TFIIS N-terminal domain-containing protein n=1 Tax=Plectus sambesii TaxID=2011161 RepID=A0A914VZW1_9BILA
MTDEYSHPLLAGVPEVNRWRLSMAGNRSLGRQRRPIRLDTWAMDEDEVRSKIEKYMEMLSDEDKIEHALRRLSKLPMNLEQLSDTGVGKAVNQLRNHDEFGEQAQQLVAKWKDVARNGGLRENHRGKQAAVEESPAEGSRKRPRDDPKEELKKKTKKERDNHNGNHNDKSSSSTKGPSFEDMLAQSDSVKFSKPKKPKVDLDWTKHAGQLDPNYHRKRVLNYEPVVATVVSDNGASAGVKSKVPRVDEDLLTMKNKNIMKIYAGRKKTNGVAGPVPTLFELCIRTICDNVDAIEDTGDIPFDILKPVLERCTPSQLFYIEQRNPYLKEDSDCLWEKHCQRDHRDCRSYDDESWRDCYQRMVHEREMKLKSLSSRVKQHQQIAASPVRTAKLADAKAPREMRKRQIRNGTAVIGQKLPTALEVSAARREIFDKGRNDSLRQLPSAVRNLNSALGSHSDKKKPTAKKGALMVKTLKMLKTRRR